MKKHIIYLLLTLFVMQACNTAPKELQEALPTKFKNLISSIKIDKLDVNEAQYKIETIDEQTLRVELIFDLPEEVQQDNWNVKINPSFTPTFNWAPHLTPTNNHVIDQHVFRAPTLITSNDNKGLVVIPDINLIEENSPTRWYMDMDAQSNTLSIGLSETHVTDHVLFERKAGAVYPKGQLKVGFYLMSYTEKEDLDNPFRKPLDFFWKNWGHKEYESGNPLRGNLDEYVTHTYNWAFNNWAEHVWQEFTLNGTKVGAPCFIVNVTQSPNYTGEVNNREFLSIWNQAWFSSLRSASGLYRYAKRTNDSDLMNKANLSKELALSAPRKEGFFYGLIATEMYDKTIDGKQYKRSKGWDTHYWGNSNRNPYTWDAKQAPFHVLDMSWTALLMLRWYQNLDADPRLLEYASSYADALLSIQDRNGYFPGWLDINTLEPMQHLNNSPESSMSVTFLLKLYEITKRERYKDAAYKAMHAVIRDVVYTGRWEDFETYWSCSRWGSDDYVGKKLERNNMYKQCNFSMFWTAEALLEMYKQFDNKLYLEIGQRVLDEMLMTQAAWQPSYIYVKALGGFGVLNTDGEWNDSRACLFAETILDYGKELQKQEYTERGIVALRSAFTMMYCPQNPQTKTQWEKVWPFFNEKDYGFTMENYGHGGVATEAGEGMGEFTIYDWGNGAAAEAYNRILDSYGQKLLE